MKNAVFMRISADKAKKRGCNLCSLKVATFLQKSCNQSYEKVAAETALNMPLSLAEIRLFFDFVNEQYSFMSAYKN